MKMTKNATFEGIVNDDESFNGDKDLKEALTLQPKAQSKMLHLKLCDGKSLGSTHSSSWSDSLSDKSHRESSDFLHPDRMSENLETVPAFTEDDFTVENFLGKGSFSDVFEVTVAQDSAFPSPENDSGGEDLDGLIDQMFKPLHRTSPLHDVSESIGSSLPGREVTFAMKRLRAPRSDTEEDQEQYEIGAADLARESAFLSSLNHPHIIKIRGRAADLSSQSQFIFVDKLQDTLDNRLKDWKKSSSTKSMKHPPSKKRVGVAICIADALRYLHSNGTAFRDLKPPNIGFDAYDMPKLFDFGFAATVPPLSQEDKEDGRLGPLDDRCGTVRYMAPEVGLSKGHGLEADVYSFGLLLWEICALRTPFDNLNCPEKFTTEAWTKGKRPSLAGNWPSSLRDLVDTCWDNDPNERPSMKVVWAKLKKYSSRMADEVEGEGRRQRGSIRGTLRRSLSLGISDG